MMLVCNLRAFAAEKDYTKDFPKIFKKEKETLTIQLENGKVLSFTDNLTDSEPYLKTTIKDYYKNLNVVLIRQQYYEGGSYRLISLASGKEVSLPETPVWNSNQQYFAAANDDESSYTESTFILGKCDKEECKTLFERKERSDEVKWKDANTVTVQIKKYSDETGKLESDKTLKCEIKKDIAKCAE